jgi:hypothetical protein
VDGFEGSESNLAAMTWKARNGEKSNASMIVERILERRLDGS